MKKFATIALLLFFTTLETEAKIIDAAINDSEIYVITSRDGKHQVRLINASQCSVEKTMDLPQKYKTEAKISNYLDLIYDDEENIFAAPTYNMNNIRKVLVNLNNIKSVMASYHRNYVMITDGQFVRFISRDSKKQNQTHSFKSEVVSIAMTNNDFLVAESSGNIHIFSHEGSLIKTLPLGKPIFQMQAFNQYNENIYVVSTEGIYEINKDNIANSKLIVPGNSIRSFSKNETAETIIYSDLTGFYRALFVEEKTITNLIAPIQGKVINTPYGYIIAILMENGKIELFDNNTLLHIATIYEDNSGELRLIPSKNVSAGNTNNFLDKNACKALHDACKNQFSPNKPLKK